MDKRASLRWSVLLSALGATVAAIFYPVGDPSEQITVRPQVFRPVERAAVAAVVKWRARPVWVASEENPFAARVWEAPPAPVEEPIRAVQPVEQVPVVAEQPAPPLPYRFLGQMQEGATRVLYLGRGDKLLLAHQGDVLESSYKVVAITESAIEFESVQSGVRQTLPIPVQ